MNEKETFYIDKIKAKKYKISAVCLHNELRREIKKEYEDFEGNCEPEKCHNCYLKYTKNHIKRIKSNKEIFVNGKDPLEEEEIFKEITKQNFSNIFNNMERENG